MGNPQRKVTILGHRGAKAIAPENTLAAFETAIEIGVDMLELDVHLSKDGALMVIHDPELSRTTNGQGMVSEYDRATLQTLNAAAKFSGENIFGFQSIPTLQEVYEKVGDRAAINVEIKTRADGSRYAEIEELVLDVVRHNHALETTVISSFNAPTIAKIQHIAPGVQCHLIVAGSYFQQQAQAGKSEADIVEEFVQHHYDLIAIEKSYLTPSLMHLLEQAGIREAVWIINDVNEMEQYLAMGVDRLTSDCPHLIVPDYRKWENARQP